jgi:hypothetical protein
MRNCVKIKLFTPLPPRSDALTYYRGALAPSPLSWFEGSEVWRRGHTPYCSLGAVRYISYKYKIQPGVSSAA